MNTISEQVLERLNSAPPEEKRRAGELGQKDFLELMIAQVRNQDPFNPMENGEFIAQMAQFATVEGIGDMQSSLSELNATMTSNQALTASTLVGRSVLTPSSSVALDADNIIEGAVTLDEHASSITVDVFDPAGALVARFDVPPSDTGSSRFSWDGRGATGERLPPGRYVFQAGAVIGGENVAAPTAVVRRIDSVTLGSDLSELSLNLDNGTTVSFSTVREFL